MSNIKPLPGLRERELIAIVEGESTDPEYGKKPEDRTMEELIQKGIINLDKPERARKIGNVFTG